MGGHRPSRLVGDYALNGSDWILSLQSWRNSGSEGKQHKPPAGIHL
jgi:hypothetical protein